LESWNVATEPSPYGETRGLAFLGAIEDAGKQVFSSEDAQRAGEKLGLGTARVNWLVSRLALAGWLRRIRRGLYATTGRLPGSTPPHDFAIAVALATPSSLSHRTALHFHGFSDQVPRTITCTTTAKVVTPSMRSGEPTAGRSSVWVVDGLRVELVNVTPSRFFGVEDVWIDQRTRVPMTDRERTILDAFSSPARIGGMSEALAILEGHVASLDLPKLASYAVRLGVAAVVKRLGWALESFGVKEDVLAPLLAHPVSMTQPLDPRRARKGPVISRWKLQDNLKEPVRR
jgi:predicted transcriptional regulator of viral defense system